MSTYTAVTEQDLKAMLDAIGVESVDELFAGIPQGVRLGRPLDLPAGLSQQAVEAHLRELAARNTSAEDELTFLGAGMYDHYVPAVVDMLMSRSEFLTPYTPYQPEISQGGLQVMFEYQTAISELTALPVANASVYEGPSAVAAAGYLAKLANGKRRVVVSRGVHPHSRETLLTAAHGFGVEVVEVGAARRRDQRGRLGRGDRRETSAVIFQQPNFLGAVEDVGGAGRRRQGVPRRRRGVLRPDPAGDPQAARRVRRRRRPSARASRWATGWTSAARRSASSRPRRPTCAGCPGASRARRRTSRGAAASSSRCRRASSTSAARRRPRTSAPRRRSTRSPGSCTWPGWGAAGSSSWASCSCSAPHYARERLTALDGVEALHAQPVVREFALRVDGDVRRVIERCQDRGVNPGYALGRAYPEHPDGLLVAVTEQRSRADIDRLVDVLGAAVAAERAGSRTEVAA